MYLTKDQIERIEQGYRPWRLYVTPTLALAIAGGGVLYWSLDPEWAIGPFVCAVLLFVAHVLWFKVEGFKGEVSDISRNQTDRTVTVTVRCVEDGPFYDQRERTLLWQIACQPEAANLPVFEVSERNFYDVEGTEETGAFEGPIRQLSVKLGAQDRYRQTLDVGAAVYCYRTVCGRQRLSIYRHSKKTA